MNAAILFKMANAFVIPGWLLLLLVPNWKYTLTLIRYGMVVILAALYVYLILSSISGFNGESFSTLENVKQLFQNDNAVLAGWIHYLAFDLMIGTYIVEQAKLHQVPRLVICVCIAAHLYVWPYGLLVVRDYEIVQRIYNTNTDTMMPYVFLIIGWVFFYAMHSVLALDSIKAFAKNAFKSYFPYYRICYNLLSVLLFVALVYYQFSLSQELLIEKSMVLEIVGAIVFMLGVVVLNVAFSSFNKREFIGLEQLDEIKQPTIIAEKKLVKTGLYGYVRHPLYFGVILMLLGMVLFLPNLPMVLFVTVSLVYLPIGVTLEERKLIVEFGEQYHQYQHEVKMLFPFLY